MNPIDRLTLPQFPRSSAYDPNWIVASVSGGANPLWLAEWLAPALELRPNMHVLDLGCGRAASSIFLAREFGVRVWATDLWCSASENRQRIADAGLDRSVFAIHADARRLPFASEFFDAIVAIDSYPYFGTDEFYLGYLARYVKPGGVVAIAGAGHMRELDNPLPEHLHQWWSSEPAMLSLHSAAWWRRHWERSGIVDVQLADTMPDGWQRWLDWHKLVAPDNAIEIEAVERDGGSCLGYIRVLARRRTDALLSEPIVAIPANYQSQPLLRK